MHKLILKGVKYFEFKIENLQKHSNKITKIKYKNVFGSPKNLFFVCEEHFKDL